MKFSVIVPVYNVEQYVRMCVDSIIKQKYKDYEIILVDDGSTDNSGKLCDDVAREHPNFVKVIHKENGGLSSARNAGLKIAVGDYIVFVDSDDYIDESSLVKIDGMIERYSPDVIALYGYKFNEKGIITENQQYRSGLDFVVTGKEFYKKALYQHNLSVGAPYYIYRRLFIESCNLAFSEGFYHEDELWTPIMLYHAKFVVDVKYRFYYYRYDNEGSITRSKYNLAKRSADRARISQILAEYFDSKDEDGIDPFEDNISAQYMYALYSGENTMQHNILREFPLKHARTFKYKMKALLFFISPNIAFALRKIKSLLCM